jgi:hypothetical protein
MQQEPLRPLDFYKRRIRELQASLNEVNARVRTRYWILSLLFLIAVTILYLSLAYRLLPVWTVAFLVPPFVLVVKRIARFRRESLKFLKLQRSIGSYSRPAA